MNQLNRGFVADLEIRSDGEGRTIHGIVVPYGQTAKVRDSSGPSYEEMFQQGAFTRTLQQRPKVKLLSQHNPHNPIGVSVDMRDDTAGLYGAFRVSNTQYANDQLELARDGALDAFSVGFVPVKSVKRGNTTVRTEVKLREVSLVTFPAYDGALVAGIRALDDSQATFAQQLLTALAVADAQLDPIVQALRATDGALDAAQMWVASLLNEPNPDADTAAMGAEDEMQMSSHMTSLARRLDVALRERTGTSHLGAAADEPPPAGTSSRLTNAFRLALRERGIAS